MGALGKGSATCSCMEHSSEKIGASALTGIGVQFGLAARSPSCTQAPLLTHAAASFKVKLPIRYPNKVPAYSYSLTLAATAKCRRAKGILSSSPAAEPPS
ncbi:hypothetical protein PC119_g3447 [Phytophthora cactorum]|nr:hypothetical protein PC119_g3447 [Phytophthora cactorum]KAG4061890.1 hypothetical protein PC123_g3220 [Phytophthora cactorum]